MLSFISPAPFAEANRVYFGPQNGFRQGFSPFSFHVSGGYFSAWILENVLDGKKVKASSTFHVSIVNAGFGHRIDGVGPTLEKGFSSIFTEALRWWSMPELSREISLDRFGWFLASGASLNREIPKLVYAAPRFLNSSSTNQSSPMLDSSVFPLTSSDSS